MKTARHWIVLTVACTVWAWAMGLGSHATGSEPVMVEFHAPSWCVPCKEMEPLIADLRTEKFLIQQIDVDSGKQRLQVGDRSFAGTGSQLESAFKIKVLPTFLVIQDKGNGDFAIERHEGKLTEKELRSILEYKRIKPRR